MKNIWNYSAKRKKKKKKKLAKEFCILLIIKTINTMMTLKRVMLYSGCSRIWHPTKSRKKSNQ